MVFRIGKPTFCTSDHHKGIICGVAFDRSSLRRITPYASVVAPRRLASNTFLAIRQHRKLLSPMLILKFDDDQDGGGAG